MRGYLSEGRRWLERALQNATALQDEPGFQPASISPRLRAKALNVAGALAMNQGDHLAARAFLRQAWCWPKRKGTASTFGVTNLSYQAPAAMGAAMIALLAGILLARNLTRPPRDLLQAFNRLSADLAHPIKLRRQMTSSGPASQLTSCHLGSTLFA